MAEEGHFLDSATDNWNEANWHKVAVLLNAVDGVLMVTGLSDLAVIQATPTAMSVIVGTGRAWINGIAYLNTAAKTLVVDAADATYTRIDLVVAEIDFTANTYEVKIVKGTPAASPTAPALTQTDGVTWQLLLGTLTIPAAATSITTAMIADNRKFLLGADPHADPVGSLE